MPELLGGRCPVCGQKATADEAPVQRWAIGAAAAPPLPNPPGVNLPLPAPFQPEAHFLILCDDPAHRTLVHGSDLESLGFPPWTGGIGPRTRGGGR